ncbi:MAG TPA: sigma 54-interacting transcriptional regulator [Pyrinomonadaceae bacterium]
MKTTSDDRANATDRVGNRLLRRCREAQVLEDVGDYESARQALSEAWPPVAVEPNTDGLDPLVAAELLLRAGTITGYLASAKQTQGAQALAKELIDKSIRLFEGAGHRMKSAEARSELGFCLWREGDFKGGYRLLQQALAAMGDGAAGLRAKAVAVLHTAVVEFESRHLAKAFERLEESNHLFVSVGNHALMGKYHNNLGIILRELGEAKDNEDCFKQAVIRHKKAAKHFEKVRAERLLAQSKNNLGFVLLSLGRFDEADEHLRHALKLFTKLGDAGHSAQVKETQARLLLGEKQYKKAEMVAAEAVRGLEAGERPAVLSEALTTWGVALARLSRFEESHVTLKRAAKVAQEAGAWEIAGLATLFILEELSGLLNFVEARKLHERAVSWLSEAGNARTGQRLSKVACRLLASRDAWKHSAGKPATHVAGNDALSLLGAVRRLSGSDSPALITGESTDGRQLIARVVHKLSGRTGRFITINCAAFENKLVPQDFPGPALRDAKGGTIFFDQVQELSRGHRGQLLRLLRDGVIEHGGATRQCARIDVRIITGTLPLSDEVMSREPGLFNLLNGHDPLNAPSAEVLEELDLLAECLDKEGAERCGPEGAIRPEAAQEEYDLAWSAALTDAIKRANDEDFIPFDYLVREVEKTLLRKALKDTDGKVIDAAVRLRITRQRLGYLTETKYPELLGARTRVVKRGRRRTITVGAPDAAQV